MRSYTLTRGPAMPWTDSKGRERTIRGGQTIIVASEVDDLALLGAFRKAGQSHRLQLRSAQPWMPVVRRAPSSAEALAELEAEAAAEARVADLSDRLQRAATLPDLRALAAVVELPESPRLKRDLADAIALHVAPNYDHPAVRAVLYPDPGKEPAPEGTP